MVKAFFLVFILAFALFLGCEKGLPEHIKVSSTAMWPTYSKDAVMTLKPVSTATAIRRGDIVLTTNKATGEREVTGEAKILGKDKRVLAIPGDTIEIKNKIIYLNSNPLKREPLSKSESLKLDQSLPDNLIGMKFEYFRETNGDVSYVIANSPSENEFKNFALITLQKEQFFVVGDNRDASQDSRSLGPVQFKQILGVLKPTPSDSK